MSFFKTKQTELQSTLNNLQGEHDTLNTKFAELETLYTESTQSAATFKSEFERVHAENAELKTQIEELQKSNMEIAVDHLEFEDKVAEKAALTVASLTHEVLTVSEKSDEKPLSLTEQLKSLKGAEKVQFYNENRKEILDALKQ